MSQLSFPSRRRTAGALLAAGVLTVVVAGPAAAHTTANPNTTAAGAYALVDMRVPHGCDGEATEALTVRIPEGVTSVKPEQVPGWEVETEIGPYEEPFENHGQTITEGVQVVTWTVADGGDPLPDDLYRDFGLSVKFPDAVGETLTFPAVQTCVDGSEEAWIETSDDPDAELDMPAPTITLTAAEGDGHGAGDDTEATDDAATDDQASDDASAAGDEAAADLAVTPAAATTSSPHPLTYVAIAIGALGLLAGAAGLRAARR